MSGIRRQRQQVRFRLSSPSVEDAVATMRTRKKQARHQRLVLKPHDDGKLTAQILGGRNSSPPVLRGRFESGDGGVVFDGVISESHASVAIPRMFTGLCVIFVFVTILLVVVGQPSPGSYICGVGAVVFGLLGWGLGRSRGASFRYDREELMRTLTPLLPGARLVEGEDGIDRHFT
jgi:hypothetical protein